jgi:hypothetical protein
MFENIEVMQMFEGQAHERQQFKVTIQGNEYTGIFHDGEVHWFNPTPKNKLEEKHISSVEPKVHDLLKNHIKD